MRVELECGCGEPNSMPLGDPEAGVSGRAACAACGAVYAVTVTKIGGRAPRDGANAKLSD